MIILDRLVHFGISLQDARNKAQYGDDYVQARNRQDAAKGTETTVQPRAARRQ